MDGEGPDFSWKIASFCRHTNWWKGLLKRNHYPIPLPDVKGAQ